MGHCEVVALLAARNPLFLQDLLYEESIELYQV